MTAVILSHIFVLGYGWFFVHALMVMLLVIIDLLLALFLGLEPQAASGFRDEKSFCDGFCNEFCFNSQ